MAPRLIEFVMGWLAILLAAAIAAYTFFGGFIEAGSVKSDLLIFGGVLAVMALGVTIDVLPGWWPGRLLLGLGTLAFLAITAISFIALLFVPAILALLATIAAFVRPFVRQTPQTR
ncbi:MAG TPA: hypothetical protein VKQ36_00130 [Ktedonobacterales bacterium]|nr:hypothetical protein [Ktedonobacterales bacterium]